MTKLLFSSLVLFSAYAQADDYEMIKCMALPVPAATYDCINAEDGKAYSVHIPIHGCGISDPGKTIVNGLFEIHDAHFFDSSLKYKTSEDDKEYKELTQCVELAQ